VGIRFAVEGRAYLMGRKMENKKKLDNEQISK
jgi:hypothetical protein